MRYGQIISVFVYYFKVFGFFYDQEDDISRFLYQKDCIGSYVEDGL